MAHQNNAAWINTAKAYPLEVKAAPLATPGPRQILIKNHALAINPIDVKLQTMAVYPIEYPAILGEDVAGEVVAVGDEIKHLKIGDRVLGCCTGFGSKKETEKAFQSYTVLESNMVASIPDHMAYEDAVVLPLGLATAAAGLFEEDYLNLRLPTKPRKAGGMVETLLIWGGAGSVGSCAIQLAVAAGYKVITTASEKNFPLVKKLGASHVFDYNSPTVVDDVVSALDGESFVGAYDAVGGTAAWPPTFAIVNRISGVKFIATVIPRFPDPPEGIKITQVHSLSIKDNGIGEVIFRQFLPKALSERTLVPAPESLVVGKGLEAVQAGLDMLGKGVSAKKIVVLL